MVQIITNSNGGGGVGLYKYKGSVDYYADLPSSGMKVGDTYNVVNAFTKDGKDYPAGTNVAWTGTDWDALGGSIDLSDYQKKLVEGNGIDLDQTTNEISVEDTVISGAALGATAIQPNDNVSELVNDAGYLVSSDLKQSNWGQTDSSAIDYIKNKPTIGNATLTIQRNGTQVNTFTANATSNVTANISVPTKTSDITNDSGFITKDVNNLTNYTLTTSLASVATSGSYNDLSNKPSIPTNTSDLTNDSDFITSSYHDSTKQDKLTAGENIKIASNVISADNVFIITEDDVTVTKDSTKGVEPYNTSYGYTNIDISADAGIEWREGAIYTFVIDTEMVASSSYRNVRVKIGDGTYIPVMGTTTILAGNTYFTKANIRQYQYSTKYLSGGALHLFSDSNTTYSAMTASEARTGTATDSRIISASTLKLAIQTHSPVQSVNGETGDVTLDIPTVNDATLTIQKNGTDVQTFTANQSTNVTANITVPTKVTDLSDSGDYVKSASLAAVATSGSYNDLSNKPTIPGVINNLTSTSTTDALSAAQGKVLKDALDNISGLGKFLSLWDSSTGQPISFPLSTPYTYTTGDWFMVETLGTTNYKPNGSSYTGAASTAVESGTVKQGDVYIYDGTDWLLQVNNEPQVSFSEIAGQPTDNTNLATALNAKQNVSNMVTTLTGADNTHYPTAKAVADAISGAGNGDMLKSTYDPNNIEANAFDYNNFINTPNLSAVATSGNYSDLSNTPSLATVATSGSYNDLSNKPTIPAAQVQTDWDATTGMASIKNKPTLATVATSGLYSDLSGTPTLATVATSGSYNDLSNKPTIPTVNNATLTIQKNGTTVKTFTANASSDVTANISVPTKTSDITNDSGYITKSVNNLDNYTLSSALATVATTGSYSDLSNKPTIPTDTSDLTNGAGFITGITSSDVTTALGYTPANDGSVVKTSGNQTIAGTKTFSTSPVVPSKTTDATNTGTAIATEAQVYKKQDTLVSGTSIKTVNGNSLLGSGNVSVGTLTAETVVSGDSGTTYTIKKSTTAPTSASNTTITFVVE